MQFEIRAAESPADLETVRELWTEYWASVGLGPEFQGFAEELRGLPGAYAAPAGLLLLVLVEGRPAATVGFRPVADTVDELARTTEPRSGETLRVPASLEGLAGPVRARRCEAKRMYVRPEFRGQGLARTLLDRVKQEAAHRGYQSILADTLPSMADALAFYRRYGFREREPYSASPTPSAIFIELSLETVPK